MISEWRRSTSLEFPSHQVTELYSDDGAGGEETVALILKIHISVCWNETHNVVVLFIITAQVLSHGQCHDSNVWDNKVMIIYITALHLHPYEQTRGCYLMEAPMLW